MLSESRDYKILLLGCYDTEFSSSLLSYANTLSSSFEFQKDFSGSTFSSDYDIVICTHESLEQMRDWALRLRSLLHAPDLAFVFLKKGQLPSSALEWLEKLFPVSLMTYDVDAISLVTQLKTILLNQKLRAQAQNQVVELTEILCVQKALNEEWEKLSKIDSLTGLSNRRHFAECLNIEWKRTCRDRLSLSVLMIDIDHFKGLNDSFGHLYGDEVLQQVARIIQSSLRRPADFVARYGGEEFVVLLPNTNELGAKEVAERIRNNLYENKIEAAGSTHLSVSVGVACSSTVSGASPDEVLGFADEALYSAKARGRNRVELYSEILPESSFKQSSSPKNLSGHSS